LILMTIVIISCDTDDPSICSAAQEEAVVEQLKNTFESCSCDPAVIKGTFFGNTVYYTRFTSPSCSTVFNPTIYSCTGVVIPVVKLEDQEFYNENVKFVEVLYRCGE
jgi:hypothetical protein